MVGDIFQGLTAFKAIIDSAKALADMHDESVRLQASLELLRQIHAAEENYAAALQRVRTLEAEIAHMKAGASDLERYELKQIGGGAAAYMLKPGERGSEPPHWLCPHCYAQGKKSIYQFSSRTAPFGSVWRCSGCGGHVATREEPRWL